MQPVMRKESDRDPQFSTWIGGFAQNIRQCIHCGQCSSSCPLSGYMDKTPRRLMHLAREGFKKDVLESFSLWLCTSCYSCHVKCPRDIPVTDVMYALKRKAIEEGYYPKRFAIPVLAKEFRKMVYDSGRISESELVVRLKLKTNPFSMIKMARLGVNLIRTGRFSLKREKIQNRVQLQTLLNSLESIRKQDVLKEAGQ